MIGTIFTDQSETILRFTLDRRPPATTAEFIDGGQNYYGKVAFTTAVAFTRTSALTVQLMEAPPPAPAAPADTRITTSKAIRK